MAKRKLTRRKNFRALELSYRFIFRSFSILIVGSIADYTCAGSALFRLEKTGSRKHRPRNRAKKVDHLQIGNRRYHAHGALLFLIAADLPGKIDLRPDYLRSNPGEAVELQGVVNPYLLLHPYAGGSLQGIDHLRYP